MKAVESIEFILNIRRFAYISILIVGIMQCVSSTNFMYKITIIALREIVLTTCANIDTCIVKYMYVHIAIMIGYPLCI